MEGDKKILSRKARKASANPCLSSLFKNVLKSERRNAEKSGRLKNVTSNILFYGVSIFSVPPFRLQNIFKQT